MRSFFLADGSASELIFVVIVVVVAAIVNLVKWMRSRQQEKEAAERRLRQGEAEPAAEQPTRVGGLASLLKALQESARQEEAGQEEAGQEEEERRRAAREEWEVTGARLGGLDLEDDVGTALVHEVESRVWDVEADAKEQGLATMDPHTLRQERRRERSAGLEAAADKVAEKERQARRAAEEAREAAARGADAGPSPDRAERVLAEEAEARARAVAAAMEGDASVRAQAAALGWLGRVASGASRDDIRRGMVWSFVLGAPRGIAPYGEEETGGVPGLRS